jgi:hypothetical protein
MGDTIEFVCLTDDLSLQQRDYQVIPIIHGWPRWWSKIELFRPGVFKENERVLYFDLDTLFMQEFSQLIQAAHQEDFMMLRGFNLQALRQGDVAASGIMAWRAGCLQSRLIYDTFITDPTGIIERTEKKNGKPGGQGGDQGFIGELLGWQNIPKLQNYLPHNYIIGKRMAKRYKVVIPDCHVIAWSGNYTFVDMKQNPIDYKWMEEVW